MNDFMKKIEKRDITFLFTLGFFVVVSIFRFFDEKMNYHETPWEFLHRYNVNKLAMATLVGAMFLFFAVCIFKSQSENKKTLYYLCAFMSIFTCPMYATIEYFGTVDMYAWILMFLVALCFICGHAVWLTIPMSFLMMYISPMSIFSCGCLILALCFCRFMSSNQMKYMVVTVLNLLAEVTAVLLSISKYGLHTDAQSVLSLKKFVVMVILLSPYLLIAGFYFKGLMKKISKKKLAGWMAVLILAIPSMMVNIYIGDYVRAVFFTFMYFIMAIMCFMATKDEDVINQMDETKVMIKKWVPIPAIVIAYPLLFITLWIAGPTVLFTEVFTG